MADQKGYTLVELILAMAIFSFVAVIMSVGLIRLYKIYQSGVQIRNTQQAARFIAEKVSRDVRDRQLVVVGPAAVSAGDAPNHTTVCMLNTEAKNDNSQTYGGVKYYVAATDGNYKNWPAASNDGKLQLFRSAVSITAGLSAGELAAACRDALPQNPQMVSAEDVSIVAFNGQQAGDPAAGSSMLSLKLSVAAKEGQTEISGVDAAGGGSCIDGKEYCSITNLLLAAGPEGGSGN